VRKLFHSLAVASLLALCAASTSAVAQSQDNTFSGAIAPAPKTPDAAKEPPGYRGVLPGHVSPLQHQDDGQAQSDQAQPKKKHNAQASAPQPRKPNPSRMSTKDPGMSARPNFKKRDAPLTAEDLKQIAAMTGVEVRLDKIPPNMQSAMHMPSHVYPLVSLPTPRRDGMLPNEYMAKQAIDRLMAQVNAASGISPEAKQKAMDDALTSMMNLASAMRIKRDMPTEIYQAMGVPSTYVSETHEGAAKATTRLEDAIKALQQQEGQ
jgi:hypothetical protein